MVYTLRPKSSKVSDRLLCDVTVEENVKVVTLRSTYKVENHTLYPLELILVDENNKPVYSLQKIGKLILVLLFASLLPLSAPGRDFPLPIEAVTQNRIKIRPDGGFPMCNALLTNVDMSL
jgi:vacuolar protein sorting-associated protein 13A/C